MAGMDDVNDDDFLVLDMGAAAERLKHMRAGDGPAICLALLLRERKPTWRSYKEAHYAEWTRIEKLREEMPALVHPGLHEPPDGYIGGFRKDKIVSVVPAQKP
jgi:hypothetical protein